MSIINSESSDWNTFLENREVCWFGLLWKYTWSWMVIVLEVVSEHALQDGIIMHTNCLHASLNNVFPHFVLDFSFNIYFFSSSRLFLSPFSLFPTSFHTYLFFFPEHSDAFSVFFFKYYFFLRDEVFFYWNVHKVLQIQHYCKGSYLENNTAVCANTDFFPPLELAIICWALSTHSALCNIKKEEDGISAPKGLQSVRCTKQIR